MIPRNLRNLVFTAVAVFLVLVSFSTPASSQIGAAMTGVDFSVSGLEYDVIYLADFLDIGTGKLKEFVPSFSAEMRPVPVDASAQVVLELTTLMILQDDPTEYQLTYGYSFPFRFGPAPRTLYSRDLVTGGSSDVKMAVKPAWNEFNAGKKKLESHLKRFPSAPVGTYRFIITIRQQATLGPPTGPVIGRTQYDLVIRNASPEEVIVTLLDPQPGEVIHTTNPTFTWRADRECEVHIYERLPMQRSLQDAIAGVPHAVINAGTAQTVSYASSGRRLEYGKTYVWFVRTTVKTNRGDEARDSEIRSFRVLSAGQSVEGLHDVLTVGNEEIVGTLTTLESMGWELNGDITLDGKPISQDEAKAILKQVAAKGIKISVHVE